LVHYPPERRIGDTYPPSRLPSIRGDYWAFDKAVLVQRNHKDIDGSLIARHELNDKLVEGTLVLVQLKFVTYIMTDRKTEKGDPMPDKKASDLLTYFSLLHSDATTSDIPYFGRQTQDS
jgi:hypothetical protein